MDELVEGVVTRLDQMGILDNTYIIYSTDNGYHISQHRMQPGKECPFETDINIPLIIRGPGVPEGETADLVTSHTDLAPTFFEMMGIPLRDEFDGTPIPFTEASMRAAQGTRQEQITVEMWGLAVFEGKYGSPGKYLVIASSLFLNFFFKNKTKKTFSTNHSGRTQVKLVSILTTPTKSHAYIARNLTSTTACTAMTNMNSTT